MFIAIHDYENDRAIIAEVPQYLADADRSSEDIADAILSALGLSSSNTEYMIGNFKVWVDHEARNSPTAIHRLEELTQDFKEDALAALEESKE